uniref:MULE transposase domain-containing protein n=1 Tax=Ditylenchus dipsaci TaxID=166011 RepID=A0A915ER19_9BILA
MRQATGVIVKVIGPHSHNKSAIEGSVRAIKNTIKDSAVNTLERPAQIFNRVLIGVEEAIQAKLDKSASRQTVKRKRKNATDQIAAAIGMGFVFPEAAKNYTFAQNDPELFLLGDELDENGNSRFVSVMVKVLSNRFRFLYALLPNKSQATYEKLFRIIRRIWPDFIPSSVSIDFEMAVISALEVVFPESDVWGCFFHLVQNMIKKLNVAGLKGRYETEPDFAVKCRMITAMAFVKPEDLMPVFAELEELLPEELDPILDWFQTYYIGFVNRRGNMVVPMLLILFGTFTNARLTATTELTTTQRQQTTGFKWSWTSVIPDFGISSTVSKTFSKGGIKNICNGKLESVQKESALSTKKRTLAFLES